MKPSEPTHRNTVRVMTWNIQAANGGKDLGSVPAAEREKNVTQIERAIAAYDPDVIMLQEVENGYDRNGTVFEYNRLRNDAAVGATGGAYQGKIGSAIILRNGYTMKKDRGIDKVSHTFLPIKGEAYAAEVQAPKSKGGATFTAVATHQRPDELSEFTHNLLAPIRSGHPAKSTDGWRGKLPRDMIAGGDFNADTATVARGVAAAGLSDAMTTIGMDVNTGARITFPDRDSAGPIDAIKGFLGLDRDDMPRDIDHILVSPGMHVRSAQVREPRFDNEGDVGDELSDHRPVIADIDLPAHSRRSEPTLRSHRSRGT